MSVQTTWVIMARALFGRGGQRRLGSPQVLLLLFLVLASCWACGQRSNSASGAAASAAQTLRTSSAAQSSGAGSLGSFQPTPQGAEVDVSVDPSVGSLAISIALPELPERDAFGPKIQLAWTAPGADPGLGFGVGFALDLPSLEVTTDWGSPYPAMLPTGDITARLSLHGQRLQFVNSEEVQGLIRIEYRLEGSEDAVRVFRWRTAELSATAAGLTWTDGSERSVIGPGGAPQPLQFQGFQVAYPDGRQEIYTEERGMAEGQAVGTDFLPIRFPLRYAISPTGDVTSYEYQLADDNRSYLRRVSFAAGRSEYLFDTAARQGGAARYAYGFAQGAKYLYTRMQARFDGVRTHEWCFVYRAVAGTSATLLTHPDCAEVANAEFNA